MAENVIECATACTVTLQLETSPADPARLADLAEMWGLFLGAAIVVLCLRKLANIFDRSPHGDS